MDISQAKIIDKIFVLFVGFMGICFIILLKRMISSVLQKLSKK